MTLAQRVSMSALEAGAEDLSSCQARNRILLLNLFFCLNRRHFEAANQAKLISSEAQVSFQFLKINP